MAEATHIQEYGWLRVALYTDGSKKLFLPTGGSLWINANAPYPEIALPGFRKVVINPNIAFLNGNRSPLWAVTSGSVIVVAARIGTITPRRVFYSLDGGVNWTQTALPDGNSGQYNWVKKIGNKLYTGGGTIMYVSEDDGQTWDEAFDTGGGGAISGIAYNPFSSKYVAIPNAYNIGQPGATSIDGIHFTSFVPNIRHASGQSFNGYVSISRNGIEFYNGRFYSFGMQHEHFPDTGFPTGDKFVLFSSASGSTWDEFATEAGPEAPLITNGWVGGVGPYFVLNSTFLVNTPNDLGYFQWLFGSWNWDASDPQPTGATGGSVSTDDRSGTADLLGQWLNYSHGRFWYANNYGLGDGVSNAYDSSDILVASDLQSFVPVPIFNEDDWYVTAKAVDWNDDLLVFERATTESAGGGSPINAITRLVRIEPDV